MNKILKRSLIILIIVLISIISFIGIYVQDKNTVSNIVKEYQLGMDLEGSRKVQLVVDTTEQTINYDKDGNKIENAETGTEIASTEKILVNSSEVLTVDNYKLTKKILQNRLNVMGVADYQIRLNESNGDIILNIPEDQNTDTIVAQLQYQGKFEIIDKDSKEILMTNDDLKSVKAGYGTTSYGTTAIFVNIEFNKEGTEKFKNISNTYTEIATTDETTGEEKTSAKEISINVDGETLLSTHFDEEVTNGILQLSVGASTSEEELQESLITANNLAALLDSKMMPIVYQVAQNKYVASEITADNIELFVSLSIVVATVGMVYLIIKYKEKGIFASISLIGFVAVLLLVLRYTNVMITIDGIVAIVLSTFLNYLLLIKILSYMNKKENANEAFNTAVVRFLFNIIPVAIIAIVFTFNSWLPVFSFGMVMFWGILVNLAYNYVITRTILIDSKN